MLIMYAGVDRWAKRNDETRDRPDYQPLSIRRYENALLYSCVKLRVSMPFDNMVSDRTLNNR